MREVIHISRLNKKHSEKWFLKHERRNDEAFKNTKKYYLIPCWLFVILFFVCRDYYHGWQQALLSFLNISIFWRIRLEWSFFIEATIWLVTIIAQIAAFVFLIKSIKNIINCRRYEHAYYAGLASFMNGGRTITNVGAPGTGKTFVGTNVAYNLALRRWAELKSEYFLAESMHDYWLKEMNTDKLIDYAAKKEAYCFYKANENKYIPCLISSIPIRERKTGRMSYEFTPEIFLQSVRAPEYPVFLNDELGQLFGCNTSRDVASEVSDYWRYYRQILDAYNINTEQGDDGNGKYIRKSTDYNNRLFGQEWIMAPKWLIKHYEKAEIRYFRKIEAGKLKTERAEYIGQKLYYLNRYIKTIGYREVTHRLEAVSGGAGETQRLIFPAIGEVDYDDRAYRQQYLAKDKPISLTGYENLVVDEGNIRAYDGEIVRGKQA